METKLVQKRVTEGRDGIACAQMIIDIPRHGRILLTEGYGGGDVEGMTYRWKHGAAVSLHSSDTFAILDGDWNESTSTMQAVLGGHDESRPVLLWDGHTVANIARAAK